MFVFWIIAEIVFSVVLWLPLSIGLVIFAGIKLYKQLWGELPSFSAAWGIMISVAVVVLAFVYVAVTNFITNDVMRRPNRSPVVDASPLATLTEEQMGRVKDAIMMLVKQGYLRDISIREVTDDWNPPVRSYNTGWISGSTQFRTHPQNLSVWVRIYRYEDAAIGYMRTTMNLNPQHRHIQNDNNTDALLLHPWMPVSASGLYRPTDERLIRSEVRINNVHFELRERRHWIGIRNNYSSQFIAALVDAMQYEP